MDVYVLKRDDGKYVARQGSESSYTTRLEHARVYRTREAAEADRCPGNERVVPMTAILHIE